MQCFIMKMPRVLLANTWIVTAQHGLFKEQRGKGVFTCLHATGGEAMSTNAVHGDAFRAFFRLFIDNDGANVGKKSYLCTGL